MNLEPLTPQLGLDTLDTNLSSGLGSAARKAAAIEDIAQQEGAADLLPVIQAIYGQESGGRVNASPSIDGARGGMQVIPSTFQQYAKPGERIDNADDNRRVGVRVIKDLAGRFGNDPARIAAGYFSGAGNVNATGSQAWREDRADGNGKTVSSYVSDVLGRLGIPAEKPQQAEQDAPDLSKAPPWQAVIDSQQYQALNQSERLKAKAAYFDYWIKPHAGKDTSKVYQQFMSADDVQSDQRGVGETILDTGKNLAAGALKIGPTALKGAADLVRLATGDHIGKGLSDAMQEGMDSIDRHVASDQFNVEAKGFQQVMADPNQGIGDMLSYLIDNPAILVDNTVTTVGSMFLPAGAAKGAVGIAAARGLTQKAAAKAAVAATIGAGAAQNAADTFTTLEGKPTADRYKGAAISAAVSILGGIATEGGADGAIAKKLAGELQAGRATLENVKAFLKGMGKEGAQESIEEVGNAAGEVAGGNDLPTAANLAKRVGFAGTVGAAMGGAVDAGAHLAPDQHYQPAADAPPAAGVDQPQAPSPAPQGGGPTVMVEFPNGVKAASTGPAAAPAEHATTHAAQAVVADMARQAGMDPTALLPQRGQLAPQDQALVDYAQSRVEQLQGKRDGGVQEVETDLGPQSQDVPGESLSPAEQQELAALTAASDQPAAIRQILNGGTNVQAQTEAGANGAAPGDAGGEAAAEPQPTAPGSADPAAQDEVIAPLESASADDLQQQLGYVRAQGKANGWNKRLAAEKLAIESEIQRRDAEQRQQLDQAAHEAATSPRNERPEPTEAQKEAGNYKKGHVRIQGLDITIENPTGSTRSGVDPNGKPWSVDMAAHYGYIKRTEGADGEQVDVYVSDRPVADAPVYVFDQHGLDGKFDEHKAVIGARSAEQAQAIYDAHFADNTGPKRRQGMQMMPAAEFKAWAESGDTSKPLALQKIAPRTEKEAQERRDPNSPIERARSAFQRIKDMDAVRPHYTDEESMQWWNAASLDQRKAAILSKNNPSLGFGIAKRSWSQLPPDARRAINRRGIDRAQWLEQLNQQIAKPGRFHAVSEDENEKGLRIGDAVSTNGTEGLVVGIKKRGERTEVNVASNVGYGGWTDIAKVEKAPPQGGNDGQAAAASVDSKGAGRTGDHAGRSESAARGADGESAGGNGGPSGESVASGRSDRASGNAEPEQQGPLTAGDGFDSMFDDVLAEELARREKPKTERQAKERRKKPPTGRRVYNADGSYYSEPAAKPKTEKEARAARQAAASAAKNTADALTAAVDGLGALFGGAGRLSSGLTFDEQTYAKAKPHFQQAVAHLQAAGTDLREAMRTVINMVLDKFGAQAAQNMKPYVVHFIKEMQVAEQPVAAQTADSEVGNEHAELRSADSRPLENVAAKEVSAAAGAGRVDARSERSSAGGAESVRGADAGRLSTARSERGSAAGDRVDTAGSRRRARLGDGRTGAAGSRVSESADGLAAAEHAPNIPAQDFRITRDTQLGQGGEVQKFNDNLAAIRIVKTLESERRRATADEQRALARYVGWGGLASAFPDPGSGKFKEAWEKRGAELRDLLTPAEYTAARRSTRNAHYTAENVVRAMWSAVQRLGYRGGLALESSLGTGNFVGLQPQGLPTRFIGVELDSLTSRIAQALYPQAAVINSGLQYVPLADNAFSLAIGNPPFGSESLRFQFKPELNGKSIHNQFFLAAVDAVRPGGLMAQVVSRYLMDAQDTDTRLALARRAKLVAAIRLPENAFQENARTQVVTDIIILQKLEAAEQQAMEDAITARAEGRQKDMGAEQERQRRMAAIPAWVETAEVADPLGGEKMRVNAYFAENPAQVLGVMDRSGTMNARDTITVKLGKGELQQRLDAAIARLPENISRIPGEVLARTEQSYKLLSEGMRIAAAREEVGHVGFTEDGQLQRVIEREAPDGGVILSKQTITADSPWADDLLMDDAGHWYKFEVAVGEDGKPLKEKKADGSASSRNIYSRVTYATEADVPESLRLGKTGVERLTAMVGMRDLLKKQLQLETDDAPAAQMEGNRAKLAKAYEKFTEKHGPVSRRANMSIVSSMPDEGLIMSLESHYQQARSKAQAERSGLPEQSEKATPAPILRERVVPKYEPPTTAASPADALAITLAERGRVDLDRIAQLLGETPEAAATKLQAGSSPLVYLDPETQRWETRDAYLSGPVKRKLNAARAAGMTANAEALEAVQPEQWSAENVNVQPGASWVPAEDYAAFAEHLMGGKARVSYSALTNSFSVDVNGQGAQAAQWSSEGAPAVYLLSRMLNSQAPTVTYKDSDGNLKTDKEKTTLAALKLREIVSEFGDWVFKDGDRRQRLVDIFNEKFNTRVNRQYDGSHLVMPGKVPDAIIALRRHQKNAVWRGIASQYVLLDHVVGAGKTFTGIARALERRRMGVSRKPTIVVPNHLVKQWLADIYLLYPGAKVLAAGQKDFEKKNRRRLFGKIAAGDWDIVVLPHSSFGFIGIAPETEMRFLEAEMKEAQAAIKEAWDQAEEDGKGGGRKPFGVKEAERLAEKIQARMDRLREGSRDRLLTFEQLGIDDLTVDEAHEFKNLFYSSRLTGVRGMGNKAGARKAADLYNKLRVLREQGGSIAFMTGTPVSNSAVELYTMQRYLAAEELAEAGLTHFDAWRAQYVPAETKFEPTESGGLKEVSRLGRSWDNMRALMDLYYQFADAVTIDDIKKWYAEDNPGQQFPVPNIEGGARQLVKVAPTPAQENALKDVIAGFDALDGIKDPYERNKQRLKLMDRARKVSLDVRAVAPGSGSDEKGGKLEKLAEQVKAIYDKWDADRGTQLIFLDRSVPRAKTDDATIKAFDKLQEAKAKALREGNEEAYQDAVDKLDGYDESEIEALRAAAAGGWNAYQQIKDNLVALGIPAAEIRFVQEANTDEQKEAIFDAVRGGRVRVLLGSTPRMGAGTNVQDRLVALHHADVTWKPSDIEQREGRIIRQGNKLLEKYGPDFAVSVIAYATERTVDAKMWDLNATKLRMINGLRKYDGAFSMQFADEDSVSMAEMAALASGNPLLLERVTLESELTSLELQEKAFRRKVWGLKDSIDRAERVVRESPAKIERAEQDAAGAEQRLAAMSAAAAGRSVTVEGKTYTKAFDAEKAVQGAIDAQRGGDEKGKYAVNIDGKRLTNKNDIDAALDAALGDATPFAARLDNQDLYSRTGASRRIAELANRAAMQQLANGREDEIQLGTMYGYNAVADVTIERGRGGADVRGMTLEITLQDGQRTVLSTHLANSTIGVKGVEFTMVNVRNGLAKVEARLHDMASSSLSHYYRSQLSAAERDLPKLREQAAAVSEFPKAAEMREKRERLAQVVKELQGPAPAAAAAITGESDDTLINAEYRNIVPRSSLDLAATLRDRMRDATGSELARRAARAFVGQPLRNIETGVTATVSGESLRKMLGAKEAGRSTSSAAHAMAVANLDHLFEIGTLRESRAGKKSGDDETIDGIHVFDAPMPFRGEVLRARMLVKQFKQEGHGARLYVVHALEIGDAGVVGQDPKVSGQFRRGETASRPPPGVKSSIAQSESGVNAQSTKKPASTRGESSSDGVRSPAPPAGFDERFSQLVAAVKGERTDGHRNIAAAPAFDDRPEPVRADALAHLRRLERRLSAGNITQAEYRLGVQQAISRLERRNDVQLERRVASDRRRGADWLVAKLRRGVADGQILHGAADFAEWLIEQNPAIIDDLGIAIKSGDGGITAGQYNPLARIVRLVAGSDSTETVVHEILHHTERMMPGDVQKAIIREWSRAYTAELKATSDPKVRAALDDMLAASLGDRAAWQRTEAAFSNGALNYDQHYQLYSPSEYWAVNGTRILSDRQSAASWKAKARQWFTEFVERIRGLLRLRSDSPVIDGLKSVLEGTGDIERGAKMLSEAAGQNPLNYANIAGDVQAKIEEKATTFSAYDKTLGTQYHKALKSPEFKKVFDIANAMQNAVSMLSLRPGEQAPGVLPRVDNIKAAARTVIKGQRNGSEMAQAAEALFAGTLSGSSVMNGKVFNDAELRDRGLNQTAIALYRQARSAIDSSLDELAAGEAYSLADYVIPKQAKQVVKQAVIADPGAGPALLAARVQAQIDALSSVLAKARENDAGAQVAELEMQLRNRQGTLERLNAIAQTRDGLKNAGYAPLMRFGKFAVTVFERDPHSGEPVVDDTGKKIVLHHAQFETEGEFKAELRRQQQRYAGREDRLVQGSTVSALRNELYRDINPETLELFAQAVGKEDAMRQFIELAASERSALKRRLQRKGIAGFNTDIQRVLAQFITSNARRASQLYFNADLNRAIQAIPKAKGDVIDEAIKLRNFIQDPGDNGSQISSLAYLWYITGQIGSAAVNAMQPVQLTLPYLTQFVRPDQAAAELSMSLPYAVGQRQISDDSLREGLRRASLEGVVDAQEVFHLYSLGSRSIAYGIIGALERLPGVGKRIHAAADDASARVQASLTLLGSMFSAVEGFNRRLTFIAAWRIAKSTSRPDPYAFAVDAVNATQGIYNKVNRPNWARGRTGRTLLIFQQFKIMSLELVQRMWTSGPAGKRATLLLLGMLMLLSGYRGLPFWQDIEDLIDTIGQKLGYATNSQGQLRAAIKAAVGESAQDFMEAGVSSLLPLDFANRLGMGNIIPGTGFFKPSDKDSRSREALEAGGAGVGVIKQFVDAYDADSPGQAAIALMPSFVRNPLLGLDMLAKGHASDTKGRRTIDTTPSDAFIKGVLGFQPESVAKDSRRRGPMYQDIALQKQTEAEFVDRIANSIVGDDREAEDKAWAELDRWNERNPRMPVIISGRQIGARVRQLTATSEDRLLKAAPRELRGDMADTLDGEQ